MIDVHKTSLKQKDSPFIMVFHFKRVIYVVT
jgi:hypothetical protein